MAVCGSEISKCNDFNWRLISCSILWCCLLCCSGDKAVPTIFVCELHCFIAPFKLILFRSSCSQCCLFLNILMNKMCGFQFNFGLNLIRFGSTSVNSYVLNRFKALELPWRLKNHGKGTFGSKLKKLHLSPGITCACYFCAGWHLHCGP